MDRDATMDEFGHEAVLPVAAGGRARGAEHAHAGHASPKFYWMIGIILTVITAVEVAIFYVPAVGAALTPTLLILSAAKFLLVVMFFMHLKFDSRIFSGLFLSGMVLAVFMTTALIVLYKVLPGVGEGP
jgi:cytochrome c oxidase subunit 4